MSPSSNIRPRATKTRGTTYSVRYRPGGRDTRYVHVATFPTLREARLCKQWVDGELAQGRRPDLRKLLTAEPLTVAALAEQYGEQVTGASALKRHRNTVKRLGPLGKRIAREVEGREVQAWINEQRRTLSPSSTRQYLGELRRIFAWGEIDPNPCEWVHLRVERDEGQVTETVDPPSLAEFRVMCEQVPSKYRPVLVVLEGTGMRINELVRLGWGDIDWHGGRIRVPGSKTEAARRFVPLLPDVAYTLMGHQAPEDRVGRVFPGLSDNGLRSAMGRACKFSGLRHFHPHDLRDRFISLCGLAGIPLPLIRQMAGHTKNTITLDIYTGVILDEPAERLAVLRRSIGRMTGLDDGARDHEEVAR